MGRHGWAALRLLCAGAVPLPLAAVTSQSFQVSATITPGCLVVGGVSNYGGLNFGSCSALGTGTVEVALTGGVQVACTPGVTLNMTVDGGQYNSGGRRMQISGGSAKVAYALFRDAAYSQS